MKLFTDKQSIKNSLTGAFILGIFLICIAIFVIPDIAQGATYYVNPNGSDTNIGTSLDYPFQTILKAINTTEAGDTIQLTSGEYREDIVSQRNGTASAPIIITGPADAIIKGGGNDRVIEINHNYHTLNGFTVDGLHGSSTKPSGYRDTLIYTLGKQARQGVEGLKVTNMTLKNAGGECLRLRYFVTKAEIAHNTITNCGVHAFIFNTGGKNGEGIYIGTSNKQWGDGKNPTNDPDETSDNIIHNNYIDTRGNECVDIKEGATKNIIERNTCRGQKDSESGGFDSRGDGNIFRYNDVRDSIGAGVRLGGALVNGIQYGKNNEVYENTIIDNKNGGIKFQVTPQVKICGNTMSGNTNGDSIGNFGLEFNPVKPCEENTTPKPYNINDQTQETETEEVPTNTNIPTPSVEVPTNTNIPTPSVIDNERDNDLVVSTPPPEPKENSVNNIPESSVTNDESGNNSIVSIPPPEIKEIPTDTNISIPSVTDGERDADSVASESTPDNPLNVFATPTIPNSILVSQNDDGQKLQMLLIKYSALFLKEIATWYFGPMIIIAIQNGLILYSIS